MAVALSNESSERFKSSLQDAVISVQALFDESLQAINRVYKLGLADDEQQRREWAKGKEYLKRVLKIHPDMLSQKEKAFAIESKRSLQKVDSTSVLKSLRQLADMASPFSVKDLKSLINILSLPSSLRYYRNVLTHVGSANSLMHHSRLAKFSNVQITSMNSIGIQPSDVHHHSENSVLEMITGGTMDNKKIIVSGR